MLYPKQQQDEMDVRFKVIKSSGRAGPKTKFRISRHVISITPSSLLFMAAPPGSISAAHAIAEYLQAPDDLAKVSAYRKKLEKEKASIDARLKTGVIEQLQATRLGLRKFLSTRQSVQAIKDEMMTMEKECEDPSIRVGTFDQIGRVCKCLYLRTADSEMWNRYLWFIATFNRRKTWSTICWI